MFYRYTEGARRVIFWARYEASAFGSTEIDTTHLLLGALRQGNELISTFLPTGNSAEVMRDQVAATLPEARSMISTSADMPLSTGAKDVLADAARESERLGDRNVRIIHLLLGLVREPAAGGLLNAQGINYERVLKYAEGARLPHEQ